MSSSKNRSLKRGTEVAGGRRYNRRRIESKLNEEIKKKKKNELVRCVCPLLQPHVPVTSPKTLCCYLLVDSNPTNLPPSHV